MREKIEARIAALDQAIPALQRQIEQATQQLVASMGARQELARLLAEETAQDDAS